MIHSGRKIRVLIVDDSAIARDVIERGLSRHPAIEVVGKASDAYSARDRIVLLKPDVVTLDIEMPGMTGIEFLRRLIPQYPIPVVVVSAVTAEGSRKALEAMAAGAADVVAKPDAKDRYGLEKMLADLADRIKEAAEADMRKLLVHSATRAHSERKKQEARGDTTVQNSENRRMIAIGASTGGTNVLDTIIPQLPSESPGVVIVQHMPPVFTRMFAESLNRGSAMEVREAIDGDKIQNGLVLVAPGGLQMTVHEAESGWFVHCKAGEKVSGHCPSVDVLFKSVARAAGSRATGLILTGMGRDGANGLLEMRRAGGRCFAQDEESSVVFGMPKEAWENGAAERLVSAERAAEAIIAATKAHSRVRSV